MSRTFHYDGDFSILATIRAVLSVAPTALTRWADEMCSAAFLVPAQLERDDYLYWTTS